MKYYILGIEVNRESPIVILIKLNIFHLLYIFILRVAKDRANLMFRPIQQSLSYVITHTAILFSDLYSSPSLLSSPILQPNLQTYTAVLLLCGHPYCYLIFRPIQQSLSYAVTNTTIQNCTLLCTSTQIIWSFISHLLYICNVFVKAKWHRTIE